ncbi:MAG TPA: potassium channel family protein [Chitinispirillaceae bacterium]|nr:potassium channel family protein [Chitinispirillaceae bacterium]
MDIFYFATGFILILTGLADLYFSILHYEGYGALSRSLQRGVWQFFRLASRFVPASMRSYVLSQGAPFMIICTLVFWIGLEISGYTLIYLAGIDRGNFSFNHRDPFTFQDALYFSSITLPTLGFGDIVPISTFYRMAAASESFIGFAIMTLSLSFIINIYWVIQQFRTLASSLYHQISPGEDIWLIIKRHWLHSTFQPDNAYFRDLHHRLLEWFENLHQFPIAYYFYSPRTFLSIPYAFKLIGELIAALRFGFPPGHPSNTNPDIMSLTEAYMAICKEILRMYSINIKPKIDFISSEKTVFIYQAEKRKQFELLFQKMSTLEKYPAENPEAHEKRFQQWLNFSYFTEQFVQLTAKDHGYEPSEIKLQLYHVKP